MSQFITHAQEIFEAAENSAAAGYPSENYTILLDSPAGRGIHMIANSDWSLGALQREHGAKLAYRVGRTRGRVMLEGRDGSRTCHIEGAAHNTAAQFLLNATPAWHVAPPHTPLLALSGNATVHSAQSDI